MYAKISSMDLSTMGEIGLSMFFGIFVIVTIWALSRPKQDIKHWAEIPIENDHHTRD